jgi:hypothetical protein
MLRDGEAPRSRVLAIFGTVTGFDFGTTAAEKDGTKAEAPTNPRPDDNKS